MTPNLVGMGPEGIALNADQSDGRFEPFQENRDIPTVEGVGISLHLGVNRVDPTHYAGWDGILTACEYDATDMRRLAQAAGFRTRTLLTAGCTRAALTSALSTAALLLGPGDIFLWTASCHGGQLPARSTGESDSLDETLCLYDGQWLDNETHRALEQFPRAVRVVSVFDACHTGTPTRAKRTTARVMPAAVALATYLQNRRFYDGLLADLRSGPRATLEAATLALGASRDDQEAADGERNGRFTAALLRTWHSGAFIGDYLDLYTAIRRLMPPTQIPSINIEGPSSEALSKEHPFSIEGNTAMAKKSANAIAAWADGNGGTPTATDWGRGKPDAVIPARASSREVVRLNDGDYVTSRTNPTMLYLVQDGDLAPITPPAAIDAGVTQADVNEVDPLILAAHPVQIARGRDQTFHLWSDMDAGHFMESWAWFPDGKVAVRTVTKTVTWFGGYTGRMTAMLVDAGGNIIPELDIHEDYGVDGRAFGSGERDETREWDVPLNLLDRADTIVLIHQWAPKVDYVQAVITAVKVIWELYTALSNQEGISAGSETVQ
jgi:hypothetical protein